MSEIQEGVITDKAVLELFEDFPFQPVPTIISDYYKMLENLRGAVSVELEGMSAQYRSPKHFVGVIEDDVRKEVHFYTAAGMDVSEYSLINSIVVEKRGFFPWSNPLVVEGIVVVENNLFDDYLETACITLDRPLTGADFDGHERSLEVTVLNTNFAERITKFAADYAKQHGFPEPEYKVE